MFKILVKPNEKKNEINTKQGTKFLVLPIHDIGIKKNNIELNVKNKSL